MTETVKEAARRLLAAKIARGYRPVALHEYVNADGVPLYWRARLEHPDGDNAPEGRKIIRPLYVNGSGYRLGEPLFPANRKPLYNLDKIAADETARLWIVEGEKAADALARLGAVATTSGGADSAGAADWSPLAGRECILWADNDDAGRAYMGDVSLALSPLNCRLSAVDVEALSLPPKGDAVDWLAARSETTLGDLDALPRLPARIYEPRATDADSELPVVELVRGDTIKPQRVDWIWPGYLAAGKLHILAGRGGCGKTTLALALAATITQGGRWPDGSRCEAGNVVIWSGEDDAADTLIPRLLANGADVSRVYIVNTVREAGRVETFDPAKHMAALAATAARVGNVRLLVADPVVSAVRGDGNSNSEVRRALQPIVDLAATLKAAALGISHFSKGTEGRDVAERVTGSLAFGAAPRVVLAAAKIAPKDGEPGGRIVIRAKSNNGPDSGGYRYDLELVEVEGHPGLLASRVLWGAAVEGGARELLREAETEADDEQGNPRQWLADYLRFGARSAAQVFAEASANGYGKDQMHRAKRALKVEARKDGMRGGWYWSLPEDGGQPPEDSEDGEDGGSRNIATFGATVADEDGGQTRRLAEDGGLKKPPPSLPSALRMQSWCVVRADGDTFNVTTNETADEMRERYPGASIERVLTGSMG